MTLREEFEDLKYLLTVKLADASVISILDCPFQYYIPQEIDDNIFARGSQARYETKIMLIRLENCYEKSRLFPSEETANDFTAAMDALLTDYRKVILDSFQEERWRFSDYSKEAYTEYLDTFIKELREAAEPYIQKIRTTTQREIELEIDAKDKRKQSNFDLGNTKKRWGWL